MQKITTKVFVIFSLIFGIIGLCLVFFGKGDDSALINQILMRALLACIFIILPSLALAIAGKYLRD